MNTQFRPRFLNSMNTWRHLVYLNAQCEWSSFLVCSYAPMLYIECVRFSRDKNSPKLYLPGNNMDPGSQPLELQVSVPQGTGYMYHCLVAYEVMIHYVISVQYTVATVIIAGSYM